MTHLADATVLPTLDAGAYALRHIRASDTDELFGIFGDPETVRYWSSPPLRDLDAARDLVADIQRGFDTRTLFQWGVVRPAEDRVIGTTTLCAFDEPHRKGEIGYALLRSEWGRGIMTEVVPTAVAFGFDVLGLHRLEAEVDPRNTASSRLLESLGFRHEGRRREAYFINDEIQDAMIYGLLAREFDRGRKP